MSITDELREWKRNINTRLTPEEVLTLRCEINRIADRIDAELEEGYIELPKDADGVPIRIGDKMLRSDGNIREVEAIGVDIFVTWNPDDRRYCFCSPGVFTHVQPDSWERIIEDAMEAYQFDDGSSEPSIGSLVERCKRLAREVEWWTKRIAVRG